MTAPKKGTVIRVACAETSWRWVIDTDDGDRMHLCGPGAPKEGKVGDKGTLTYTTGASFGLWFWTPSRSDPTCGSCR